MEKNSDIHAKAYFPEIEDSIQHIKRSTCSENEKKELMAILKRLNERTIKKISDSAIPEAIKTKMIAEIKDKLEIRN